MHKGFTLIELLIVVVIVGILVTIALPQYKRAAERGRAAIGLAAVRQAADKLNAWYITQGFSYPKEEDFANIDLELVGVGSGQPFSGSYDKKNNHEASISVARDTDSGWIYTLTGNVTNGQITSITCSGSDCAKLGLNNL